MQTTICLENRCGHPHPHEKRHQNAENYGPISLLKIDSKVFEKCMNAHLQKFLSKNEHGKCMYAHLRIFLSKNEHGFVKKIAKVCNMLQFLNRIYESLDFNPHDDIIAFYDNFSKACDKVTHQKLLQKLSSHGKGGCFLDALHDYLSHRQQFVRIRIQTSAVLEITSGVLQGSILGPPLFCIFVYDLPDILKFMDPFVFPDDLETINWTRI